VLFLSFSRAAVARLGEAMKQEVPKTQRSQLSMQTFHSFFWTLLSAHGYLLGAPRKLRILLPQDEQVEYGSIRPRERNVQNADWRAWLKARGDVPAGRAYRLRSLRPQCGGAAHSEPAHPQADCTQRHR
jgi:DNA helicase-2/ATP-dependent DNA helicase PcrA